MRKIVSFYCLTHQNANTEIQGFFNNFKSFLHLLNTMSRTIGEQAYIFISLSKDLHQHVTHRYYARCRMHIIAEVQNPPYMQLGGNGSYSGRASIFLWFYFYFWCKNDGFKQPYIKMEYHLHV